MAWHFPAAKISQHAVGRLRQIRVMTSQMNHLLKIAPLSIILFISAWYQFQLLAWLMYKDQSPYGVADGGQNVTLLPSSLPAVNSTLSAKNDTSNQQSTLFLQQSDSLYRKYNISTTPVVIAKYKLLLFTIEKTGSTVSELSRTTMCCRLSFKCVRYSHHSCCLV